MHQVGFEIEMSLKQVVTCLRIVPGACAFGEITLNEIPYCHNCIVSFVLKVPPRTTCVDVREVHANGGSLNDDSDLSESSYPLIPAPRRSYIEVLYSNCCSPSFKNHDSHDTTF
jgi:hypothetical protein